MDLVNLDEAARKALGLRIQQALNKQRLTQKQLADRAGYDEKTIRNIIRGDKSRYATLADICAVLNIDLQGGDAAAKSSVALASEEHGGYSRANFEDYFGAFVTYRRSFTFPGNMLRSVYDFQWSDAKQCLVFREAQKYQSAELETTINFSQEGEVFISNSIGLVHLLTKNRGALRLITLTKLRLDDLTMRGTVLTQAQGEFYYQPSVSPILFQKADPGIAIEALAADVGPIRAGDADYDRVNRALIEAERRIGIFALALPTSSESGRAA